MRTIITAGILVLALASAQAGGIKVRDAIKGDEAEYAAEKAQTRKAAKAATEASIGMSITNVLSAAYIDAATAGKDWVAINKILTALAGMEVAEQNNDAKPPKKPK